MSSFKILSLDGSGTPLFKHPSREFCVTGAVINEKTKNRLNLKLKKIKKNYFNDKSIILHYIEIIRKIKPFNILKDQQADVKFWSEILSILNNPNIIYFFTIVNKQKAKKAGWQEKTIAQKAYAQIIKMFIYHLKLEKVKGKIITESDIYSDEHLIKAHNIYQSTGLPTLNISAKKYNETITSLSLVNKNNDDPEVQLVDLLGATARLRYRIKQLSSQEKISKVERKKLKLIERKIKQRSAKFKVVL